MTVADLTANLEAADRYDYTDPEDGHMELIDFGPVGNWDPPEHVRLDISELPNLTWGKIKGVLAHGRDVAHHTRVTGYMSTVEGWNKGKIGELRDRHRSRFISRGVD